MTDSTGSPRDSAQPKCPGCAHPLPQASAPTEGQPAATMTSRWPHFPFCSRRCALLDLNAWLTGEYAIPGDPVDPDENEA